MKQFYLTIIFLISSAQFINAQGIIKDDFLVNNDSIDIYNRNPAIAMNNTGSFVIAWNDHRNGWGNWDVFFQMYNVNGNPIGTNVLVNDDAGILVQEEPTVAMNSSGNFVIAWEDERQGFRCIYYQLYDSNGSPIGINRRANEVDAVGLDPAISMNDAGNFVIAWKDHRNTGDRDIYFQIFDSGGNKIGVNVKANDDPGSAHQEAPAIAMDGSGNFVIAWKDFRNGTISDIYLQRYSSNGTPIGSNTRVDDDPGNGSQYISSIAIDGSGNFIITWDDDRSGNNIYFQMYDNNGNPIGSNVKVSDNPGIYPATAMEANGDFVITWMTSGSLPDVMGQRYFANGTPNGGNYLIVEDGPNEIEAVPQVAANSTQIAFAWDDNRRNGFRSDIYAKLVTWNWSGVTDVELIENNVPDEFSLLQNYPNPFNPNTRIIFTIPQTGFTSLKVYDVLGDQVATLVSKELAAGEYEVDFIGSELTTGIYFYQLKAGSFVETKKMILMK